LKGKVVFYDPKKQFGFIRKTGGSCNDIFFHAKHIANPGTIKVGNYVEFYLLDSKKGKRAISIHVLRESD